MATVIIPTSASLPDYTERVQLDGVTYGFRFRWNWRGSLWFMDLFDAAGVALAYGRPIRVDELLIQQQRERGALPPGEIMAFDTTRRALDPGLTDFGTRVLLLYIEAAEFA